MHMHKKEKQQEATLYLIVVKEMTLHDAHVDGDSWIHGVLYRALIYLAACTNIFNSCLTANCSIKHACPGVYSRIPSQWKIVAHPLSLLRHTVMELLNIQDSEFT